MVMLRVPPRRAPQKGLRTARYKDGKRRCSGIERCGRPGHFTETKNFAKNAVYVDGLDNRCRKCMSEGEKQRGYLRRRGGPGWESFEKGREARRAREKGVQYDGWTKDQIYKRDKGMCYLCGYYILRKDLHIDHVVPFKLNGPSIRENVMATHNCCNLAKNDKSLAECEADGTITRLQSEMGQRSIA